MIQEDNNFKTKYSEEYHFENLLNLKFLNKYIYHSCNENIIYFANLINDRKELLTNETKIQEDKFFFSFLIQVINI